VEAENMQKYVNPGLSGTGGHLSTLNWGDVFLLSHSNPVELLRAHNYLIAATLAAA
jgi:hypothetical protein